MEPVTAQPSPSDRRRIWVASHAGTTPIRGTPSKNIDRLLEVPCWRLPGGLQNRRAGNVDLGNSAPEISLRGYSSKSEPDKSLTQSSQRHGCDAQPLRASPFSLPTSHYGEPFVF